MRKSNLLRSVLLLLVVMALPLSAHGQGAPADPSQATASPSADGELRPTDRLIVRFADGAAETLFLSNRSGETLPLLSTAAGAPLAYVRPMALDSHVLRLPGMTPLKEVEQIAANLMQAAGVALAEPDRMMGLDLSSTQAPLDPNLIPNDPRWSDMWHLQYTPASSEGLNMVPAWNISVGSASTVVAVIDTGILPHNDLAGKTVPGYDFIGDLFTANDGDGRDPNPSDPGDWNTTNQCYPGSPARNSSWHGTHVAGTIAAASNNSLGVAGVNWNARILPVRVLGKCGGYTSDIIDGMLWSASLPVPGVPPNANRAKVLNLSLGGAGSCGTTEQNAINQIVAAGSTVVVAAGNSNANASGYRPANCNNVITVASTNRQGNRAYYSNYGSLVKVSAPGGETASIASNGVLSTLDSGLTTPNNSHTYAFYQGTSMAAPHVSGLVSLVVGLQPGYTQAQVLTLLQSTARPFPSGSTCSTSICGAGIVDAYRALLAIRPEPTRAFYLPLLVRTTPPPPPNPFTNPGFESGTTGWIQYSAKGWPLIINSGLPSGVTPHGGSWLAWLGGDYNETAYIQQQVTVPAGAPYLAYWHWIASQDACGYDLAKVRVNGVNVHQYDLCSSANTGGWVKKTVDLSAYANQTVTLQVRIETNGSLNSNLFVDDFAFQATAAASAETVLPLQGADTTTDPRGR